MFWYGIFDARSMGRIYVNTGLDCTLLTAEALEIIQMVHSGMDTREKIIRVSKNSCTIMRPTHCLISLVEFNYLNYSKAKYSCTYKAMLIIMGLE